MNQAIQQAIENLERIIVRENSDLGDIPEQYRELLTADILSEGTDPPDEEEWKKGEIEEILENSFYLSKDAPEIFKIGSNQVILSLGNGYLGKFPITLHAFYGEKLHPDGHYVLDFSGFDGAYERLIKENEIFRELGFEEQGILLVPHHYGGITPDNFSITPEGNVFAVVPDLTENGLYQVEDISQEHLDSLSNGPELKSQIDWAYNTLESIYGPVSHPHYSFMVNRHVTFEDMSEGVAHMFFVKINPINNTGKLILGDLDHIFIRKSEREQETMDLSFNLTNPFT